jgi:hypothetical protein
MADYDATRFDPPAPVAVVTLRTSPTGPSVGDVLLLIDTGADVTLLPKAAIARLGIDVAGGQRFDLVAFDGCQSQAIAVTVEMIFLNRLFRGQYLVTDEQLGILGRDILNHLGLVFDGPRLRWRENSPAS